MDHSGGTTRARDRDGAPALPLLTDEQWRERQPRRRGRRRKVTRPSLVSVGQRAAMVAAAATIGVCAAVMVLHASEQREVASVAPTPADVEAAIVEEEPIPVTLSAQTVVPGSSFAPIVLEGVRARSSGTSLTLEVTTAQGADLRIVLHRRGSVLRARDVSITDSGVHRLRFAGLPDGSIRWRVSIAGEPARHGRAAISIPRSPTVPTPIIAPEPPRSPDKSGPPSDPQPPPPGEDKQSPESPPKGTGGTGGGHQTPRDPDTDPAPGPIDPDDP